MLNRLAAEYPLDQRHDLSARDDDAWALPILFINRDCDTERRVSVCNRLRAANLRGERVAGVDGLNVPAAYRDYFFTDGELHSGLKPGEVGCYASHLKAMQLVLDMRCDSALVLEDDAFLHADFPVVLRDALNKIPRGWDLVHLCLGTKRAVKPVADLMGGHRLVRYSRVPENTTGYLISRIGAQKFLRPSKRYWPVDTDFRQPWLFDMQIYGVTPQIISHDLSFESSIKKSGSHSRLRRGFPRPTRHCWTGNPLHTPRGAAFNFRVLGPTTWLRCSAHNLQKKLSSMFVAGRARVNTIRALGLSAKEV